MMNNPYTGTYSIHAEVEAIQPLTLDHENKTVIYGVIEEITGNIVTSVIDVNRGVVVFSVDDDEEEEEIYGQIHEAILEYEATQRKEQALKNIRLDFRCISMNEVGDAESFYNHVDFAQGVAGAIEAFNKLNTKDPSNPHDIPSADWFSRIYYTSEDDGYYFYTVEDLGAVHEEEGENA